LNFPYEIVVVDDASTGRTTAIARELGAPVPDKFFNSISVDAGPRFGLAVKGQSGSDSAFSVPSCSPDLTS